MFYEIASRPLNTKRNKAVVALCLVLCLFLASCGEKEAPPPPKSADPVRDLLDVVNKQEVKPTLPSSLATLTSTLTFSGVKVGGELTLPVILNVEGDEPLTIQQVQLASEQSVFTLGGACADGLIMGPNKTSCRIDVTFRPQEPRAYQTTIIVTHSAKNSPLLVQISGVGEALVDAPPPPLQVPEQVIPYTPSFEYINAQRLQEQRKTGTLQVLQTGDRVNAGWKMSDEDYASYGYDPIVSSYPVNRDRMITSDRYIPAVLESTINTQIGGGRMTAIVENHVYSASGRNILIPAGSRLIGTSQSLGRTGRSRLDAVWTRIIRPDGVNITVQSPASDPMGRNGMVGYIDYRLFNRYIAPLLVASIGVGLEYALSDKDTTTTTFSGINGGGNSGTTTSETVTPEQKAGRDLAEEFAAQAKRLLNDYVDTTPVLTIPSGTRFLLTPTQDLVMRTPTLITSSQETNEVLEKARQLVFALQRGDLGTGTQKLAEVLGNAAQVGQRNEAAGAQASQAFAPVQGGGQFNYGPPPTVGK
jgi:type IV secretory pathway VirB10-like protein